MLARPLTLLSRARRLLLAHAMVGTRASGSDGVQRSDHGRRIAVVREMWFVRSRRYEAGAVPPKVTFGEVDRIWIVCVSLIALADPGPEFIVACFEIDEHRDCAGFGRHGSPSVAVVRGPEAMVDHDVVTCSK